MLVLGICSFILSAYLLYLLSRFKIYFFFYTRQSLLAVMGSFSDGRALAEESYYQLHHIPPAFLFKHIEKHFFRIHWNPSSIRFLIYSGFIPYYLQQKKADPLIIGCLWDVAPDFCSGFIRSVYPELPVKSQSNLLLTLIPKGSSLSMELLYLFVRHHTVPAFAKHLIRQWKPESFILWFESKIHRPDFSYVFFSLLPLMEPAESVPPLIRLLPRFNASHKLLLMDCIAASSSLEWLPILNILSEDEPLIRAKAAATRKELLDRAQNRSHRPSLQRREDAWKYIEQFAPYLLP